MWEAFNTPHDHPALVYRIELDIENRDEEICLEWLQAHNDEMVYVMFTNIDHDPARGDVQSICGKIFDKYKNPIPKDPENFRNQDIRESKWQEQKETSPRRFSRMSRSSSQSSLASSSQTVQKPIVKVTPRMSKPTQKTTATPPQSEMSPETVHLGLAKPEHEIPISVAEFALNDSNEVVTEASAEENLEENREDLEEAKNLLEKLHDLPSIESVAANNVFDIIVKR